MHSTWGRVTVATVAVLLATVPVAGAVTAGGPGGANSAGTAELGGTVDRPSPATDAGANGQAATDWTTGDAETEESFGSDAAAARALGSRDRRANATVTATGGRAAATGTDDVVSAAPRSISVTQRIALTPETPGEVRVTHAFEVPETVTTLETPVPDGANVTEVVGFVPPATGTDVGVSYELDGNTSRARITYTLAVNETVERVGPEGADGRYLLVDAGEWALVRQPELSVTWRWRGPEPVGLDQETTTAGPGYAGEQLAYLGPVTTRERTAHGQTFTLVVPRRANMAESPEAVLDALANASDRLRVGDRDEKVTMFVAPTGRVEWGVRGLQLGDSDAWVRDGEPLEGPDNTWLHEYVHTRQSFETARSGRWLTEATATYYPALVSLERNETDFRTFREFLGRGATPPQSGAVLVEPRTWDDAAGYWKGALVTAAIDRRIRLETNGTRSFETVFSRLNADPRPVDWELTLGLVEAVGGHSVDEFAGTYITTGRVPPAWSAAEHEAAFRPTPARFTYRFSDPGEDLSNATVVLDLENETAPDPGTLTTGFAVSGPYRTGSVEGSPLTLYTGETLRVTGVVENTGGAADTYDQLFVVRNRGRQVAADGSVVTGSVVSGSVAPGERAVHPLNYTAETAGGRTVSFGADTVDIEVYEPAPATLGPVTANRTALRGPGFVALNVTVVNPHDAPARRNVSVTRDGTLVTTRHVGLPAETNRTVTVPVRFPFTGQYDLSVVDGPSITVTVTGRTDGGTPTDAGTPETAGRTDPPDSPGTATPTPTVDVSIGSGPGFGPVGALLGMVLALTALALGRRRRT